jgi:hypothetical protein
MIIMNIAEWIANLLILGIAAGIWVATIFGAMLVVITLIDGYKKLKT